MSRSVSVLCKPVEEIATFEAAAWTQELREQLRAGARVVSLFGRPEHDDVLVTALFERDRRLTATRARVRRDAGLHSLTPEAPQLHAFERELYEQTGLDFKGHPWLKPLRFEGRDQAAMNAFPYYSIEGKEVHEVAVGPIHAGVIEPGSFRFMCHGEQVHHLEVQLGYQHRAVEKLLLRRDVRSLMPLVETIAGDSSVAHGWAYCAALEALVGCEPTGQIELLRAFALELERVGMHLATLSGLAADIGHLQGATSYGRLRTTAINSMMRLCGSRFGRRALRPGGVGLRASAEWRGVVSENLQLLQTDLALINDCFLSAHSVRHRLRGVGALSLAQARELGLVGVSARACGVRVDARDNAGGAYAAHPISIALQTDGDCWARAVLRVQELDASLAWLTQALQIVSVWNSQPLAAAPCAPSSLAFSVVEGFRGEIMHALETDASGAVIHYKVQDPSLRNWMGLALAVRQNEISDFPVCNKSFDLSYCGHDL